MRIKYYFYTIPLRLRSLLRRAQVEQELNEELRYHLERQIEEHITKGMTPEKARYTALRALGGIEQRKEECRDMRRVRLIEDLIQDLRYGLRTLRRNPGFVALSILILTLGIGANTAVFSVVNAVLLRPLSYRDPDRIVTLTNISTTREAPTALSKQVSIPDFEDWQAQSSSFEAMACYASREKGVMKGSTPEYVQVTNVSSDFFRVFAVEPLVGRSFTPEETKRGSSGAAMISYNYWQTHFGGDVRALGQTVSDSEPRSIVGVLPPGFRFPDNTDIWMSMVGEAGYRSAQNFQSVGRIKSGMPLANVQAEMTAIAGRLEQQYPKSNRGRSVAVTRLRDEMVGDVRMTLYLLLGSVTVVLLIACANTATLLLAKASTRGREIALRAALGASRKRIVRQLVTESLLLALIAGLAGLVLAYWGSKTLVALAPADVPRLAETGIDRWVLGFTLGISVITSIIFGSVPAFYASKVELSDVLKQGVTPISGSGRMASLRGFLVVIEIALAVTLVCASGLL
ncbi:MAG: ABC transporter permease, partial [Blastocatellia bacterium]|nr:ABC transporter permease [Blastocatellia bacterium]